MVDPDQRSLTFQKAYYQPVGNLVSCPVSARARRREYLRRGFVVNGHVNTQALQA